MFLLTDNNDVIAVCQRRDSDASWGGRPEAEEDVASWLYANRWQDQALDEPVTSLDG